MNSWGEIILVILALGMAILIQLRVSKMRSPILGLVLPFLILVISVCVLVIDLQHIKDGTVEAMTNITAWMYFACYNIPTILFLCIYNYYQRTRLIKYRR